MKDADGDTLSWDAIPFHFLSLPRITHAAAEDGDLGESCGLDLGLSVFAQPTTWSDRLKLAMKHYVLLSLGKVRKVLGIRKHSTLDFSTLLGDRSRDYEICRLINTSDLQMLRL